MKKLNLWALLLGAALFIGFGATSLSADSKCGAGKCGDAKDMKYGAEKKDMKHGAEKKGMKHGTEKKATAKCGDEKKATAKCGDEKKAAKSKCGTGKCGDAK